jgi:hypothetical protein
MKFAPYWLSMQAPKPAPLWFYSIPTTLIVLNFYTIIGTLSLASEYSTLNTTFPPVLRISLAIFWIITFTTLSLGLTIRHALAFMWIVPALTLYGLANILVTVMFARADYAQGQIWFQVTTTVLALLPVWWFALRRHWIRTGKSLTTELDRGNIDE